MATVNEKIQDKCKFSKRGADGLAVATKGISTKKDFLTQLSANAENNESQDELDDESANSIYSNNGKLVGNQ